MTSFFKALSFLTILPGKSTGPFENRMVMHFPSVGLLIGGLLVGVDWMGSLIFPSFLRCAVDVLFLAVITGGLHLDGLADSADGLFSHKSRGEILEIMKDPRVGVMGVIAISFCLLLKVGGVYGLSMSQGWFWLLLAPAFARSSQVVGLLFSKDARKGQSIGSPFYKRNNYSSILGCMIPISILFFINIAAGVLAFVVFASSTAILLAYFHSRIGGMTGDTFGAMTEIVETLLLVTGAAFQWTEIKIF